jgi:hypothetical protein
VATQALIFAKAVSHSVLIVDFSAQAQIVFVPLAQQLVILGTRLEKDTKSSID